ncbi:MAG: hypothetical protein LKG26_02475 [Saccharofermentans sp.]|jgi:hypothetical protein|nr:hypothetical protein [Mageeibacillus sp.]MCI1264259.1 hypothetical protein [Saccharofermentans sp.]MCI1274936.1 hypothetical protein [Saccharofermentans sp.]MCI1769438.1 hypothetical protein [Mageeibacillus sp.]MCI2044423.1 hypothetical protein [Mageeibacillus sp.]
MDKETINRIQTYLKKARFREKHFMLLFWSSIIGYGTVYAALLVFFCIYLPKFATLFGIVFGVLPVAVFVVLMIKSLIKPEPDDLHILFGELYDKGCSALELQQISIEYGLWQYIQDFIIEKRCEELGLTGVPAVCAKDGIMPTEDMSKRIPDK